MLITTRSLYADPDGPTLEVAGVAGEVSEVPVGISARNEGRVGGCFGGVAMGEWSEAPMSL